MPTVSAGCSFYNVTITFKDGTWKTMPIETTRKDKAGHLTRRSEFSIMNDVRRAVEMGIIVKANDGKGLGI